MFFNIYYMNFPKVYEIKMILSNIIKISQEVENDITEGNEKGAHVQGKIQSKLGGGFLNIFNADGEVGGNYSSNSSKSKKMVETFEVKATKSVILNEIAGKSHKVENFSNLSEGQLVTVENVKLSLENEEELRSVKILSNGFFKGVSIPEAQGLDINNMFDSMFKDYSYKLKGNVSIQDSPESIMVKIPMKFENEFESDYGVDDLFVGSVTLIGIYKGVVRVEDLKNTFQYFTELGNTGVQSKGQKIIQNSKYNENDLTPQIVKVSQNGLCHYIDILAIVQNITIDGLEE